MSRKSTPSGFASGSNNPSSVDQETAANISPSGRQKKEWTFLTNHGHVLSYLAGHPQSTIREISEAVGITERGIQKIIATLQSEGYVGRSKKGRGTIYTVNPDLPMRHRMENELAVRNLLLALGHNPEDQA